MNRTEQLPINERLARYRHIGQIELGAAALAGMAMLGEAVVEANPQLVAFTGIASFVLAVKGLANIAGANDNGSLRPILARNLPTQNNATIASSQ